MRSLTARPRNVTLLPIWWWTAWRAGISVMHGVQYEAKKLMTNGPFNDDRATVLPSKVVNVTLSSGWTGLSGPRLRPLLRLVGDTVGVLEPPWSSAT